jgi:hypothetical protein
MNKRDMLSPHFSLGELLSPEDPVAPGPAELEALKVLAVEVLERIRRHAGRPLAITSGYRSPEHNKRVGGASGSQHTQGIAADIAVASFDEGLRLAAFASTLLKVGGVGLYARKSIIHVDIRGHKAPSVGPRPVWWYQDERGVYGGILAAHKAILRRHGAGGL